MSERITMPQLGETVTEGTILRWLVKVGDEIKEDDPILEISTDKVDTEVPSPFNGIVSALLVEEGETVEVGSPLLELDGNLTENLKVDEIDPIKQKDKIEKTEKVPQEINKKETTVIQSNTIQSTQSLGKVSPVVRKLAAENNIDLLLISGTGKDGRITRKDIDKHLNNGHQKPEKVTDNKSTTKGEIPRLRKKIAKNFKHENNFSLTYLPFIAKAAVSALLEFPVVNSSFDIDKDLHTIHEEIKLGIAVDINQEGLLVGTIKEADSYNLTGTARKISEISTLLRDGSYKLDDVSGSTFTISNNGSFNSFLTSPIINQPNVAILSTESVKKRPVVIEMDDGSDSISIRHIGILSLTWDHRVFDGSTALLFLNSIKTRIESTDWSQEIS
jgi:pyruvate/2-oxoglutarate dehydrogenase complex dihydrolipoamide acyltransferase (E2) component